MHVAKSSWWLCIGKITKYTIIGTTNIDSLGTSESSLEIQQAYQQLAAGETGYVEYYDSILKDKALFYFDQIPSSEWGIGLMFYYRKKLYTINDKYGGLPVHMVRGVAGVDRMRMNTSRKTDVRASWFEGFLGLVAICCDFQDDDRRPRTFVNDSRVSGRCASYPDGNSHWLGLARCARQNSRSSSSSV